MSKMEIKKGTVKYCCICNKEIFSYHRYYAAVSKRKTIAFFHWECYNKECLKDDPYSR